MGSYAQEHSCFLVAKEIVVEDLQEQKKISAEVLGCVEAIMFWAYQYILSGKSTTFNFPPWEMWQAKNLMRRAEEIAESLFAAEMCGLVECSSLLQGTFLKHL